MRINRRKINLALFIRPVRRGGRGANAQALSIAKCLELHFAVRDADITRLASGERRFEQSLRLILEEVLPMVVVTRPSTPVNSMRELIALAKRRPGEVTYGSAGHGGSAHLAGAMLETMGDVKMTHVSFRGNAPALVDPDFPPVPTAAESGFAGFE